MAIVKSVPCDQHGELWDCPVVLTQLLGEGHSLKTLGLEAGPCVT